jgi:hypothetical protein
MGARWANPLNMFQTYEKEKTSEVENTSGRLEKEILGL